MVEYGCSRRHWHNCLLTNLVERCSSGSSNATKTNKAVTPPGESGAKTDSCQHQLSNTRRNGEKSMTREANAWKKNALNKLAALRDAVKNVRAEVKRPKARGIDRPNANASRPRARRS